MKTLTMKSAADLPPLLPLYNFYNEAIARCLFVGEKCFKQLK